jgi:hypothetical protein
MDDTVRLHTEAVERLRAEHHFTWQEFERHASPEREVFCLIDHTHTAPAEFTEDCVVRDG